MFYYAVAAFCVTIAVSVSPNTTIQIPLNMHDLSYNRAERLKTTATEPSESKVNEILAEGLVKAELEDKRKIASELESETENENLASMSADAANNRALHVAQDELARIESEMVASQHHVNQQKERDHHAEKAEEALLARKRENHHKMLEEKSKEATELKASEVELEEKAQELEANAKKLKLLGEQEELQEIRKSKNEVENLAEEGREEVKHAADKYSPEALRNTKRVVTEFMPQATGKETGTKQMVAIEETQEYKMAPSSNEVDAERGMVFGEVSAQNERNNSLSKETNKLEAELDKKHLENEEKINKPHCKGDCETND